MVNMCTVCSQFRYSFWSIWVQVVVNTGAGFGQHGFKLWSTWIYVGSTWVLFVVNMVNFVVNTGIGFVNTATSYSQHDCRLWSTLVQAMVNVGTVCGQHGYRL